MATQDAHQFTMQALMSPFLFKFNFMQKFRFRASCFLHDIWQIVPSLWYQSLVLKRKRTDLSHGKFQTLVTIAATLLILSLCIVGFDLVI